MRRNFIVVGLAVATLVLPAGALEVKQRETVYPSRFDLSPPLTELAERVKPPVRTALSFENPLLVNPHLPPADVANDRDAVVQNDLRPDPGAAVTPSPNLSFAGSGNSENLDVLGFNVSPPDPNGDIGLEFYVQWINLILAIYDKDTGDIVLGPVPGNVIWNGFGGECETNNSGDPIVLFDHLAERWVLTQLTASFSQGTQCFAVSETSDPLGSYFRYQFSITPGGLNDYPKVTVWQDGYYISTRDFAAQTVLSAEVVEREKMLAGDPNPGLVKFDLLASDGLGAMQPAHLEGPAPPAGTPNTYVLLWDQEVNGGNFEDGYRLWDFSVDWDNNQFSFEEQPQAVSSPFDSQCGGFTSCVEQPPGGEALPVLSDFTMYRAQFRDFLSHQSLLVTHTVDSGNEQAGMRWVELRRLGGNWSVHQEGTYAPGETLDRWMGSIGMDRSGNLSIAYSASSSSVFPGVRYTTREPGDPLGTLPGGEELLIAGSGVQQSAGRWGDYSAMSIDPVDGCTFWYTGEYVETTGAQDWDTRIGSWTVPSCGTFLPGFQILSISGDAGGNVTWTANGASSNAEVRFFCNVQGATKRFEIGVATANGAGTVSFTRFVPDQAGGSTIECRGLDTETYSVTDQATSTL